MTQTIKWSELTEREKNKFIHTLVMGHASDEPCTGRFVPLDPEPDGLYCTGCGTEIGWHDEEDHEEPISPTYTTDMGAAWLIVDKMSKRMGYKHIGYEWLGPIYKPEHHYLSSTQHVPGRFITHHFDYTKEGGFSLGSPCWYVKYTSNSPYTWIMADTPQESVCIAALKISGVEVEK